MKRRLIKYGGLVIGLLILFGITALPTLAATAELNIQTDQIAVGDMVQFSIVVSGGSMNVPQPEIKLIDGLSIRYLGPSSQFQFVNGKTSSTVAHNYVLTAVKAGTFTLGPFEIKDGSQTLTTNAIQLTVTKGAASNQNPAGNRSNNSVVPSSNDSQLFLTFSVPKTKIYWGEQIPITFRLYIGDVRVQGSISAPTFEDSHIALDQVKKTGEHQETINGQTYQVVDISGVLTPVKTGSFSLGPAKMVLPVMVRNRASLIDDFFDDNYVKRMVQLNSKNTASLSILPLPDSGRPSNFSGGIGHFQLTASAGPTQVLQGDPVTIKMTVSGSGNFKTIAAPYLVNGNGLKVYDPQRKENSVKDGLPSDRVSFEQVVIPLDPKVKQIGPIAFSYFDPDSGSYRQVTAPAIAVTVKPNPNFNAATVVPNANTGNEELGQDLIFIKNDPGHLQMSAKPVYHELWFMLLQLLPVLGLIAALLYRRKQAMLAADTPESRALRANTKANRRLETAAALKFEARYEELLEELHLTIRQYLGEKFNLAAAGMTVKVVDTLNAKGVPAEITEDIREFFERYDYHRFTGSTLTLTTAHEFWDRAVRIISALDNRKKTPVKTKPGTLASRGDINGK